MAENKMRLPIEYAQMNEFWSFIDSIKEMAPEYNYICARERRCFNLVAHFLPDIDMISSRALILKYDEIAEYYRYNRRFPRILILDDLMIHGRGIAKFMQQLEDMLANKLLDMGVLKQNDNYRYTVYRNLADAVTIYVYAQNASVSFLADGYMDSLNTVNELYGHEIRDLSFQLASRIRQWGITNTSYVYSIRSEFLMKYLLNQKDGRIESSKWVRKTWNYGGEKMILYTSLHGRNTVNRVDTIRFFPERGKKVGPREEQLPLLTSFSFFGDLKESTLSRLFKEVFEILQKAGLKRLADIFREDSNKDINFVLIQPQTQLVSFILSVASLMDFCQDVVPQDKLEDVMMQGDIWKISRNFGRRAEIRPELMQIRKKALRNALKDAILRVIDEEAEELIHINPINALMQSEHSDETAMDAVASINNDVRRTIYHIGMKSERTAFEYRLRAYPFMPEEYQEHSGKDGIISLKALAQEKQFKKESGSFFSYLAAFIAMMDSCAVGVRIKAIHDRNGEMRACTIAKAGEMASFYLPEKLAMFVPVFAELESNIFGSPGARKRTLKKYLNRLVNVYFGKDCSKLSDLLGDATQVGIVKKAAVDALELQQRDGLIVPSDKLMKEIDMLYDGGHSFYGWNFRNLIVMRNLSEYEYQGIEKLRQYLINEIEENYSIILPPEN